MRHPYSTSLSGCFSVLALSFAGISSAQVTPPASPWMDKTLPPAKRAELVLKQMTLQEKTGLLHGNGMMYAPQWQMPLTPQSNGGAGMVEGVPRLGIPRLYLSDAAYGVRSSAQNGRYSTALPSNLASAAAWSTEGACDYGTLIGRELRAQGYNMSLGGGVNLTRDPRNGRTFEYLGEDPLLAGILAGNVMRCEQAQHVIGHIKHFALNDQETGRNIVDVKITQRAMQETDLLAFHIALDLAHPGAVMCSYNRVNADYACENEYLLKDVLKRDWHFPGFVISDWGGTHSTVKASRAGLDQEQPMAAYFGEKLEQAVADGRVPLAEIDDHARRILYAEFAAGLLDYPLQKSVVDPEKGLLVAQSQEEASIVLLRNRHDILPLQAQKIRRIAVIGGHADVGMISGGGSAQVDPPVGSAIFPPGEGDQGWQAHIWFPTSPLKALRGRFPGATIDFASGDDRPAARALAKGADVVLVFATQWSSEGLDLPSLALPDGQDQLIEDVASANPRTVVVLESGSAVTMPWLDRVGGVVEAWYAGSSGHRALVRVLAGDVNPSGKLPMTFPRSEIDLPRTAISALPAEDQGQGSAAVSDDSHASSGYFVNYDEGLQVGYKWFEVKHKEPLFSFGYGLSYTTFAYSDLHVSGDQVSFYLRNTGQRSGVEIAQIYATPPKEAGEPFHHLVAWTRVQLDPGQSKRIVLTIDRRVLSTFEAKGQNWHVVPGPYKVEVGSSVATLPLATTTTLY